MSSNSNISSSSTPYVPLVGGSIYVPTIDVKITGSSSCFDAVCGKYVVGRNSNSSSCFGMPVYFNHTIPAALASKKCASEADIHVSWATNNKTGALIPYITSTDTHYPYKCIFSNGACAGEICNLQRQPANATSDGRTECYSDPLVAMPAPWLPKLANVSDQCAGQPVTCVVVDGRSTQEYSGALATAAPKSLVLLGAASAALGLLGVVGL
ncbi:uncharacterized protein LOC62_01G001672 [Vanrija pseudolonga]|uniref:Uncharacterized protein n=1 Tax=Vanrija pseudolonga TaxID=143232 RepID=A0AAF1BJA2_9TREE|nr:hypothetical protein LOC62_01G001672 [Vanrija pseudolonga]